MEGRKVISSRPTHGTANIISFKKAVPERKPEKELFWGNKLIEKINGLSLETHIVHLNKDDSNGQHDLLLKSEGFNDIGIQVTEFTSLLTRRREENRKKYIDKLLNIIEENLSSLYQLIINIHFKEKDVDKKPLDIKEVYKILIEGISRGQDVYDNKKLRITVQTVPNNQTIYLQGKNNIYLDVDFDLITKDIDYYKKSLDEIISNKSDSKSPWLLIWSVHFWQNKHVFGNELIKYMKSTFKESHFEKVFFLESLDIEKVFDTNLKLFEIK